MTLAPIAMFVHRRPWHTLRALYALSRCPEAVNSTLYAFSDAPRTEAESADVNLTREVVRSVIGFKRVELECQENNRGLSRSIISGVTKLCNQYGKVIVLEDDLLVARSFLSYMNGALHKYAEQPKVAAVSGHSFRVPMALNEAQFLPSVTTWGWATWSRAWQGFEESPSIVDLSRPTVRHAFDIHGAYPYSAMLRSQQLGEIDSWGIRWWWSVFQRQQVSLFPFPSLVTNIGFGAEATNTRRRQAPSSGWHADQSAPSLPDQIAVDPSVYGEWRNAIWVPKTRRVLRATRDISLRLRR
jgi:hypothetical protein